MKLLLIFLFPLSLSAQSKGKISFNQSVKIEINSHHIATITNKQSCESMIELKIGNEYFAQPVKPNGSFNYQLTVPYQISVHNATPCSNGTTSWLHLDSEIRADSIRRKTIQKRILKYVECENIPVPFDSIATKLSKT